MKQKNELLTVLLASMTLTVCGGAWGDGGDTLAPVASAIVTSVPAATYEATSSEALAYETLNAERLQCGFGLLAQNARLDQAATAHLNYLEKNKVIAHLQKPGMAGFTGVRPSDRAAVAGYDPRRVSETMATAWFTEDAEYAVRRILSAPYHLLVALHGLRDVGVALGPTIVGFRTLVMLFGLTKSAEHQDAESQDAGKVLTYPCEGSTGVLASIGEEAPTPFPEEADAVWGQPILVKGASDLRVAAVWITGHGGSVAIKALYGDGQTTDPNGQCKEGVACIIPAALVPDTSYIATVTGKNAGARFRSTFRFRTGAR
ncbi:CAP domain-containing protein [Verminephrobacter aporrectodeae subsp. tuberculatae]|uniref:CAP domain-containing protein n=1 Tax=Verminephrobacter aporrectodeae subsp. tuberculatae TaxID=1110392 RepID=A0ABT3KW54_9BURK|nr:CAP domain-containing protein [Verminephrobacter aporrectodeae]MCW5322569.1 CAP domain-containing protein [Verminephrobacter aporrectodeae subsp. tuberculatae]MCW8164300.1 CAP domain-containing protein [Verminephrobacter aporrectodeae subsp. tuberculatae]MCW8168555.1 CAP domain-containing protein [Verminephrobacter aporrectodeae subsp. tuberculatae]MCW8199367.1 CAP domain-containing protein [Verminephrobacter aporrectodeae subsp. tuberculatae]